MGFAALDYELTPDEMKGWVEDMYRTTETPGAHGRVEMIPSMERYIWHVEGVFWGDRRVLDSGRISYGWVRPPDAIADCIEDE